jgi:hypothetical protein
MRRTLAVPFAGLLATLLALSACSGTELEVETAGGAVTTAASEPVDTAPRETVPRATAPPETTDSRPGGLDPATVEDSVGDAFAALGGMGGGDMDLSAADMACLVDGMLEDPLLVQFIEKSEADPFYEPTGAEFAALFGVIGDCNMIAAIADDLAESDPIFTADNAECFVEGMVSFSPEVWDGIMGMDADPDAMPDMAVLTALLELFGDCGLDMSDF